MNIEKIKKLMTDNLGVVSAFIIAIITAHMYFIGFISDIFTYDLPLEFMSIKSTEYYITFGFIILIIFIPVFIILFLLIFRKNIIFKSVKVFFFSIILFEFLLFITVTTISIQMSKMNSNKEVHKVKSIKLKNDKSDFQNTYLSSQTKDYLILVDCNNTKLYYFINKKDIVSLKLLKEKLY